MSKQSRDLAQYGNNQNGREMKENYKEMMDQSLDECVIALKTAKKIAKQNRDVEALIVIAEHWAGLAGRLKDIDKRGPIMLGFTSGTEEQDDTDE